MPRLPDASALGAPPQMADRPIVQLNEPRVGGGAEVLKAAAEGASKLFGALQAKQEEEDDYAVQKKLIEFDLEQEKRLDDAKRNAAPEAKDFTTGYRSGYDESARKFMEGVPERLKPKLDEVLVRRGAAFEKRAYDFELAERDRYHIADVNKGVSDLITGSYGNPDSMEDNAQRGVALIRSSKLSARAKIEAERKFLDQNADYGIRAQIDRAVERGEDVSDLIAKLRKVQRGSLTAPRAAGDGVDLQSVLTSGKAKGAAAGWAKSDPTWASLDPFQKAAAMALLEADGKDGDDAKNALGAMINRAAKNGEDLGAHVSQAIYQPTIERAQQARLKSVIQSDTFQTLTTWARDRAAGKEGDPVNGATHFLAHEPVMRSLSAKEPQKYRSWRGWTGYDNETGQYRDVLKRDKSHAFLAPEGRYESPRLPTTAEAQGESVPTSDKAPVSDVQRTALPEVGEVAKGEDKSVKIDPETGKATLSTDIGDTKSDIPPDPKVGEPTTINDEPEEADEVPYPHLSPATRRKLINYARTSGRAVVTRDLESDIARLRLGREPVAGPDGKTSLDRARSHMTHMQFQKAEEAWREAKLEHEQLSPIRGMTREQAADHVAGMIDRAEGDDNSIRAAARVQKKADQMLAKVIAMREKDPVRSVNGFDGDEVDDRRPPLPNTREAMKAIAASRNPPTVTGPNGERLPGGPAQPAMTPQQQWETLIEARLKDQQSIMPDEPDKHRIISRAEGEKLLKMPKDGKGLDEKAYRARLEEAAKRAEATFGPKYAKRVLEEAIGFHLSGGSQEQKFQQSRILRKVVTGEAILADDVRQLAAIDDLARRDLGIAVGGGGLAATDRMGRSPIPQPMPGNQGAPAIAGPSPAATDWNAARPVSRPNDKQIQWLRQNPDAWAAFDAKFGPGAAAMALGNVETGKPKDMPKAKGDTGKFSERKPGWFGR